MFQANHTEVIGFKLGRYSQLSMKIENSGVLVCAVCNPFVCDSKSEQILAIPKGMIFIF